MIFFVDANVILYAAVASPQRAACAEIVEAIAAGEADGRTSTAVLEEVWHMEHSGRAGKIPGLTESAYRVSPPSCR